MPVKALNENSLLVRILLLFVLVLIVVAAQSVYSVKSLTAANESIDSVYQSMIHVEELAREISVPIAKLRMLSMELVLAPNMKIIRDINEKLESNLDVVNRAISSWGKSFAEEAVPAATLNEVSEIESAWAEYKNAHAKTADYVNRSIRVASFISVTQEEKEAYENLLEKLTAFNLTQHNASTQVYTTAQAKSSTTYWTLQLTTITAVTILLIIMFVIHRMVHGYMVAKKKYEKELSDAMVKANVANQAKSEFLANMSHEIRTPMNAVLGFTDILGRIEADPKKKRYIDNIYTSGHALLNLINDILDLSKVEAGKFELQFSATSLMHLFHELEIIFLQKANDKGLQLILNLDEALPESLVLDEVRLRQVLINLIGNAVKFTESGFVRVNASVTFPDATHSTLALTVTVQDSGIGIAKDQQSKIFAAFEQAAGQKVEQFGGTGLGLAISQRLIDMMGGTVSVESELGQGSTFSIELPQVEVAAGKAPATTEQLVDFAQLQFNPATLLVADDVDYNREILQTYLADFDFTVYEAVDGKDTLAKTYEQHPDLILLDMKMPGMDGYAVARALNDDPAMADIPVIAVTASALKEDEAIISKLCDGYLRKPVGRKELIGELMKYLAYSLAEENMIGGKKEATPTMEKRTGNPEKLSGLLQQLEGKIYQQWDNREQFSISETGAFAEAITQLGEQFDDPPITNWGAQLQQAVAAFDIVAVNQRMSEFPDLLQELNDDLSRLGH